MSVQPQPVSTDHRSYADIMENVQKLHQAGFNDDQTRALAAFVSDVVRDTMRPFMEQVNRRFDALEQRVGGLERSLARLDEKIVTVQRREWMALAILGLGFVGVITAVALAA